MRERYPGARFAVAIPTGPGYAALYPGDRIDMSGQRVDLPGFDVGFLEISPDGKRIAGQAQVEADDPRRGTWLYDGQWHHVSLSAHGAYPCIFAADGTLVLADPQHNGSQGWRYVAQNGSLVTGDDTLNDQRPVGVMLGLKDLWEYSHFAGVTIGQGEDGCHVLIDGQRRLLEPGHVSFIRVKYANGIWAISLTKLAENTACIWWLDRAELSMLPLVTSNPVPVPPIPVPEPIPVPVIPAFPTALLTAFAAKFPLPQTPGGGEAHENRCREWCLKFAEQVVFSTGDVRWGVKRSAGPQSKDTIAYNLDSQLVVFDLMTGAGTGAPTLNNPPHGEAVSGQTFIPVAAINHLGDVTAPPAPVPVPVPQPLPGTQGDRIEALLTTLAKHLGAIPR